MAITLRNKAVEEKIRRIGRRTGEGPSAVIARLVTAEEPGTGQVSAEEQARRLAWWEHYKATTPAPTPEELAASQEMEDAMYDEDGVPR